VAGCCPRDFHQLAFKLLQSAPLLVAFIGGPAMAMGIADVIEDHIHLTGAEPRDQALSLLRCGAAAHRRGPDSCSADDCVPARAYEELMDLVEHLELGRIADAL
jgi:hypothetical protein